MNNVVQLDNTILIVNGGNPLPDSDCPTSYEKADKIENKLNENTIAGTKWSFDCGFKLDFDGSLLNVSSRFYPPKTHYGDRWDGECSIYLMDEVVASKKIKTKTLKELKREVEQFVKKQISKIFSDKTTKGN